MEMEYNYIVLIFVGGLFLGIILGWFFGSRPASDLQARLSARDVEVSDLEAKLLLVLEQRATLAANAANFSEQKANLIEAQDSLKREFEAAGAKILGKAQDALLERAQQRFTESEEKSAERLKALLAPVDQRLKSYEEHVTSLEAKRVDAFGQLSGLIEAMRTGQEQVRTEAARLGNVLRNAPKMRGRWGEQQLRNVLEQCGLAEHTDFVTEHSVETNDGRIRPDALVFLPGNKLLVIDAKVSLNDYYDACEATDDDARDVFLDRHVTSVRNHIQTLGTKRYQSQFPNTPDYTIMFVPGENHLAAALEHDERKTVLDAQGQRHTKDLWTFAFERRVLLVSPTTLVAIARTVSEVWRQDGLARDAREIGRLAGDLYERLAVATEHLKRVGVGLGSAVNNYNKFVGSFERNVISAGRRLRDLGAEVGKREIEEVLELDSLPRHAESEDPALLLKSADPAAAAE